MEYNHTLTFKPEEEKTNNNKKKRRRNILWFNPPFNRAVTTKLGKSFLSLIDKNFPERNPLRRLLNRNNVKISYSCMSNIKSYISAHNKKVLQTTQEQRATEPTCNCRRRDECPLENRYQQAGVYKATIQGEDKFYIGSSNNFKKRYSSHKYSFKHENQKNATTLSHFIWDRKLGPDPRIKWEIVKTALPYQKGSRACALCLTEKLLILENFNDSRMLNRKTDIALKCKHKGRHRLSSI